MQEHIIYTYKFSTDIEKFQNVAENENLSKNDLRVFLFLCCRMGSKHVLKIDKGQMSESLNIPKKKVSESIDNLVTERIIMPDSDDHIKSGYRMAYTGRDTDYDSGDDD
jgi:predicted transcriptional regulator